MSTQQGIKPLRAQPPKPVWFGGGGSTTVTVQLSLTSTVLANTATPYTATPPSGFTAYLASCPSGAPFVFNLPAATGSNNAILIKKQDANAQSLEITPSGTDTIDGVNAAVDITIQFDVLWLVDYGSGTWAVL